MRLRIKYIENIGYFSQVKKGLFSNWKTISSHLSGYGLYSNNHIEYLLKTRGQALALCKIYEQWVYNIDQQAIYFKV